MKTFISIVDFKCPVCGAEDEPTAVIHSELPPEGRFNWGETCDNCIDAMAPEEREAHHKSMAYKSMVEVVEMSQSGTVETLEKATMATSGDDS